MSIRLTESCNSELHDRCKDPVVFSLVLPGILEEFCECACHDDAERGGSFPLGQSSRCGGRFDDSLRKLPKLHNN